MSKEAAGAWVALIQTVVGMGLACLVVPWQHVLAVTATFYGVGVVKQTLGYFARRGMP